MISDPTRETEKTFGGKDETRCGLDSFMMRDGICDELTNIERCFFDGGDCCFEVGKKDTSMCKICTCKMTIDVESLAETVESTNVRMIAYGEEEQELIRKTEKVVKDVVEINVCFGLCLKPELSDLVNAWTFDAKTFTCSCHWLESTKCIDYASLSDVIVTDAEGEEGDYQMTVSAFIQLEKALDCGKLRHSFANWFLRAKYYIAFR